MAEKPQEPQDQGAPGELSDPQQKTPRGLEIPVPKRGQIMDALAKVTKPKPKR
jgi:hypothetical protein